MVVSDLDIVDVSVPSETYPPLVVDPDTPLAVAIAGKLLQPVPRRNPNKIKGSRSVELFQLALGNPLHILRQLRRKSSMKKLLGLFA